MNSIDAFQRRLRNETITVEKEIASHNRQLEALNQRLQGLRRAAELLESEQAAVVELLQTGTGNGLTIARQMPIAPASRQKKAVANPTAAHRGVGRSSQIDSSKARIGLHAGAASHDGGLTRLDMMAAVLRRHPRRSVRELIALLNKEYRWKTTESAVTGHLYTRRDKFVHTPPDRATNRPVTWSAK
ncbi:MAG: hypothetical protein JO033_24635 [Acidobacteriaceae bacterium]|nr:hypothetical protein [Acidobacteriaceae bacterium]MBV9498818.1 hypothetical protein [Acidobacteriaceae bacterium]